MRFKIRTIQWCFSGILAIAFSGCAGSNLVGYDDYSEDGSAYGDDYVDISALPNRDSSISMYGPGSSKVEKGLVDAVYFSFDSSTVEASEMPKVQEMARYVRERGKSAIVAGHTDSVGTFEYNRGLGERRAMAVRGAMINQGAPAQLVQTISMGEEMPSGYGSAKDRRADFGISR